MGVIVLLCCKDSLAMRLVTLGDNLEKLPKSAPLITSKVDCQEHVPAICRYTTAVGKLTGTKKCQKQRWHAESVSRLLPEDG